MGGLSSKNSDKIELSYNKEKLRLMYTSCGSYIYFSDKYFANVTVKLDNFVQILEKREYRYDKVLLSNTLQQEIIYCNLSSLPSTYHDCIVSYSDGKFKYETFMKYFNKCAMYEHSYQYVKVGNHFYKRILVEKTYKLRVNLDSYENIISNRCLVQNTLNDNIYNTAISINEKGCRQIKINIKWKNIIFNLLKGNNFNLLTILLSPCVIVTNYSKETYIKYFCKDLILDEKGLNKKISNEELNCENDILQNEQYVLDTHIVSAFAVQVQNSVLTVEYDNFNDNNHHDPNEIPEAVPID